MIKVKGNTYFLPIPYEVYIDLTEEEWNYLEIEEQNDLIKQDLNFLKSLENAGLSIKSISELTVDGVENIGLVQKQKYELDKIKEEYIQLKTLLKEIQHRLQFNTDIYKEIEKIMSYEPFSKENLNG